jgi:hypothetical protein
MSPARRNEGDDVIAMTKRDCAGLYRETGIAKPAR